MSLDKYKNITEKLEVNGTNIVPYLLSLAEYMHKSGIKLSPFPSVKIKKDKENSKNIFGKTAYYNPELQEIVLYTEGRHPKDILRSFSHELIHHNQKLRGTLTKEALEGLDDPKYIQNNKTLNLLEKEAYLAGNLVFRNWTENIKK